MPSVHKVLGFLLSPNPHTLFLLTTRSMESELCQRLDSPEALSPLWDGGSLWTALSHRQSHGFSSEAYRDRFRSLLGSTFAPKPCPVSLVPAHLLFLGTSPRRCPGRWGPRAEPSTPRLPRPGSGSISLASCAPGGWTPAAVRVAGTAGRDWRPWLSVSGSLGVQRRCTARTEQRRVLPQRPEKQSFSFVSQEFPPCSPQSRRLSCSAAS